MTGIYTFLHLTRFVSGASVKTTTIEISENATAMLNTLVLWIVLLGLFPTVVLGTLEPEHVTVVAETAS